MGGFEIDTPVASVSPFDANFAARADPALRLWRLLTGERSIRSADSLTQLQRQQLVFALRALDATSGRCNVSRDCRSPLRRGSRSNRIVLENARPAWSDHSIGARRLETHARRISRSVAPHPSPARVAFGRKGCRIRGTPFSSSPAPSCSSIVAFDQPPLAGGTSEDHGGTHHA